MITESGATLRKVILDWQVPAILIFGLVLITAMASLFGSSVISTTIVEMMIRVVVVVGIYIFIGNSGIISFGHIGFMCVGAYAAAWLGADPIFKDVMLSGLPDIVRQNQYPFVVGIALAVLLPTCVALGLGIAIMRLSGVGSSIATFAFLMIVNSLYSNWDSVTAGVSSITGIPTLVEPWTAVVFAGVAICIAFAFQTSRFGIMLKATRDDPIAAVASGVGLVGVRLLAFVLSAAVVGAGGGLYAYFLGILTVDPFYLQLCFLTIAMLVVGGMSSLTGAVSGVVFVTIVTEFLRALERGEGFLALPTGSQELGLGVLMAVMLVVRPLGLSNGKEISLVPRRGMKRLLNQKIEIVSAGVEPASAETVKRG